MPTRPTNATPKPLFFERVLGGRKRRAAILGGGAAGASLTAVSEKPPEPVEPISAPPSHTRTMTTRKAGDPIRFRVGDAMIAASAPVRASEGQERRATRLLRKLGFAASELEQFQRSVGLEATGELDARTFRKLQRTAARADAHREQIGPGQKGARVRNMQLALRALGYYDGPVDSIFGGALGDAVRAWKADHPEIRHDGARLGRNARRAINREAKRLKHSPERAPRKASSKRRALDRAAAQEAQRRGIGPGSPRRVIRHLQRELRAAGYEPHPGKAENGRWDGPTEAMLHRWQRKAGLRETSRLRLSGWNELRRSTVETTGRLRPKIRVGERSDRVLRVKRLMVAAGKNPGPTRGNDARLATPRMERVADQLRRKYGRPKANGIGRNTVRLLKREIRAKKRASIIAQIPYYHELSKPLQQAARRAVRMGLVVTSTTHGGHASTSYHYAHNNADGKGHAIDVAEAGKGTAYSEKCARFVRFYQSKPTRELFYDHLPGHVIGGHLDHVHLAM